MQNLTVNGVNLDLTVSGGRSGGGRPYEYDRGFNQGKDHSLYYNYVVICSHETDRSMIWIFQVAGVDMETALTTVTEVMAAVVEMEEVVSRQFFFL